MTPPDNHSEEGFLEHDHVDCAAVMADVYLLLDHECDQEVRKRLEAHLDECGPCLEAYGVEEKIKRLLSRKCGGDRAPKYLRERLTIEIRKQVTIRRVIADD
ncbi:mycothiol system anti-sigma-R factor [Hoyosella sp. YIM 151337]|uniref:mycothiol system anti-sigma-R factor n=1 Tax=Hoyosella sp. YIM 151337 TaxID=2992742 RepID=UPI00223634D7|nr:mycothiol system anti-sigma-R factor [Hoyosella sp. YIM 151337]MCW4352288.1 mycothiol system anti-sigma-R factor [Hoyosella sp. YIM 151337]